MKKNTKKYICITDHFAVQQKHTTLQMNYTSIKMNVTTGSLISSFPLWWQISSNRIHCASFEHFVPLLCYKGSKRVLVIRFLSTVKLLMLENYFQIGGFSTLNIYFPPFAMCRLLSYYIWNPHFIPQVLLNTFNINLGLTTYLTFSLLFSLLCNSGLLPKIIFALYKTQPSTSQPLFCECFACDRWEEPRFQAHRKPASPQLTLAPRLSGQVPPHLLGSLSPSSFTWESLTCLLFNALKEYIF